MVHMVGVDIGDDGDIRVLLEESPIAFIGFGDNIGAFPQDGIAMQVIDFAADDDGRVLMTFFKDLAQHGRCRRLAVGTGYGNPLPPAHDMDQASERWMTGIPRRRASASSTLVSRIADEMTTTWASCRFSGRWPIQIRAPFLANCSVTGDALRSEPDT